MGWITLGSHQDNVAERLRRQPAKLMGYARVGSNPIVVVFVHQDFLQQDKKISAQPESNQRPRDISCSHLQSPALPTELYADYAVPHRTCSYSTQTHTLQEWKSTEWC